MVLKSERKASQGMEAKGTGRILTDSERWTVNSGTIASRTSTATRTSTRTLRIGLLRSEALGTSCNVSGDFPFFEGFLPLCHDENPYLLRMSRCQRPFLTLRASSFFSGRTNAANPFMSMCSKREPTRNFGSNLK